MRSTVHAPSEEQSVSPLPVVFLIGLTESSPEPEESARLLADRVAVSLRRLGLRVEWVADLDSLLASAELTRPALAIVELRAGNKAGFEAMGRLERRWPSVPVLALAERPSVPEAVHAMSAGALWYGGPAAGTDFERAVREALDSRPVSSARQAPQVGSPGRPSRIVGGGPAMCKTLRQAALVAPTRTTVLLLGETGTGKERLAQSIHEASPRRHGPFVAVNCAALADTLLESELFGHEKGAFSGAHCRREGRFKTADGGTIFLDEIGEISLSTQVKLLRVLQERRFERAGGSQTLAVDVRIIAATNRDLRAMVENKTFRADLFYRLNVMTIEVPPLRDRREDLPALVAYLLPRLAVELGLPACELTPSAMRELTEYDWPGNVRELENTLQRALVMNEGARFVAGFDLPSGAGRMRMDPGNPGPVVPGASFREIERHAIMTTYEACGRSPVRTAEVLGISARTVHYRLREYRGDPGRRLHVVRSDARGAGSPGSQSG